ncbi:MAG: hypothetical protein MNPFHGCM_01162 [Gemmatimonadaceae bacterium]|nr:hypothetical protein [Gemmatimonadaceae bacterium]
MSAPFAVQLRARPGALKLGSDGEPTVTLRVQVAPTWDVLRVVAPAATPVSTVKQRALDTLLPDAPNANEFVTKLNGWEVLDESVSVGGSGAGNGSTFLLLYRRRRPVR